ncbi:hypothetical protein QBC35DRAFT_396797, partial [Podospora australis]
MFQYLQQQTQTRTFAPVTELKSAADLEVWSDSLRLALNYHGLTKYLIKTVRKPEEGTLEYLQWTRDRMDIYQVIRTSVRKADIWKQMTRCGWDSSKMDPKKTYEMLFEVLRQGPSDEAGNLIREYTNLKRENFDSVDAFLDRFYDIKSRLEALDVDIEMIHAWTLLTSIKETYSDFYNRWSPKVAKGTVSLETLTKELNSKGVQEKGTSKTFVKIQTKNKKENDKATQQQKREPRKQVNCTTCNKKILPLMTHCGNCDHHHPKDSECWPPGLTMVSSEVQQASKAITRDTVAYDSGSSFHTFNDLKWFTELHALRKPHESITATGEIIQSHHMGSMFLYEEKTGHKLAMLDRGQGIPTVRGTQPTDQGLAGTSPLHAILASINYRVMHRRMMHAGKAVVELACKRAGIDLTNTKESFCEPCVMGKAKDEMGKVAPIQAIGALEFIRMDVVTHGEPGHLGYKYSIHFI